MVPPRRHVLYQSYFPGRHKVSEHPSNAAQDLLVPAQVTEGGCVSTQSFLFLSHPHISITTGAEFTP